VGNCSQSLVSCDHPGRATEVIAKSAAQNKNIEKCNHTLELQISFSWMLRSKYNGRQTHAESQGT
jgi:hypothetical protein